MTETADGVRREFRGWLQGHWDPDLSLLTWRRLLAEARWAAPSWPERWHGRGLPAWADDVVASEIQAHGAVGTPMGVGMGLAAPTILAHGPDHLRERFLLPILTGEHTWCQLFSEPGAGSDLAGLTTRAVLDGDTWIVNGQKVWNTSAHHADLGLLAARSDWDVPKHQGITYLAIPMHQPGVTVRPLRQMNGHASFNEVFFTDARVPADHVIGEIGGGWAVARTTLAHERRFGAMRPPPYANRQGRAVDEARAEMAEHFAPYVWYPQRAGRVDLLVERAKASGCAHDPAVRQEIARVLSLQRASAWTAERARANRAAGREPGPEGSIGKLALSQVARAAARAHSLIAGPTGMLAGPDAPLGGTITEVLLSVPAQSIAGGTDEVQKNIVAERLLGLPREPDLGIGERPFRELPRNA
jgi:alkylation response protein AidB-like acyl-CoA dehydrogenase